MSEKDKENVEVIFRTSYSERAMFYLASKYFDLRMKGVPPEEAFHRLLIIIQENVQAGSQEGVIFLQFPD